MGRRYQTTHPWLHHLHVWRVCGCERYLIFSHTTDDTLFVQRVFHGSREIEHMLDDEEI